jgi:hypothetical protein
VYQRLLGRAPAEDELKSFLASKAENKRKSLVDQLLAGDEYAGHWAERWATALVGPRQDHKPQDYCDRDGLVEYLRRAFRDDKPYDRMVYELLAACGSTRPGADDYNGAVNFLVSGANQQGLEATDRTSRFFLGKQLVCTRCHDHPATGWEQGEFWELNAFLRQMKVRAEAGSDVAVLTDQDFYGESGAATDAEIFYPLPNGRLGMAYPKLNGREIARSGLVDDVNRRQELAKLVIAADEFPRAIVNRVWGWLMGYGFTQPIDDMGLHNPPSHPELLARLADELAAHDYNLKGLVRWIVLSEPFSLSGKRTPESWMDVPAVGGRPLFARWYEDHQPQDPSDIYHALVRAVHSRSTVVGSTAGTLARRLGTPSAGPVQIIEPQPDASGVGPSWLAPLASSRLPPEQKIQHVFLSVAGRAPTSREMTAAKLVLADRLSDSAALREIWLTLVAAERAAAANGS